MLLLDHTAYVAQVERSRVPQRPGESPATLRQVEASLVEMQMRASAGFSATFVRYDAGTMAIIASGTFVGHDYTQQLRLHRPLPTPHTGTNRLRAIHRQPV